MDSDVLSADPGPASPLRLIAIVTFLPLSLNRVVAKRIFLTGHIYKFNKRVVTVRYLPLRLRCYAVKESTTLNKDG